jgi:hypothetical protein
MAGYTFPQQQTTSKLYMMPSRKCKSGILDKAYMIDIHKRCFYDLMNCNHLASILEEIQVYLEAQSNLLQMSQCFVEIRVNL